MVKIVREREEDWVSLTVFSEFVMEYFQNLFIRLPFLLKYFVFYKVEYVT